MGLGLSDFLQHASDKQGSGGKFLDWKGDGKVDVWLHCRAPIESVWSHQFIYADTVDDKETGKPKKILRWPRFVSPDPEVVHRSQYFREDGPTSSLQVRPDSDPFLLLREWLRFADDIALDQPIFEWFDPKDRRQIQWCRGELSGLEKRGQQNFGHSLDSRLDYYFVVLVVGGDSLLIAREGKLLGQRIADVIRQQQEALGEQEGDPTINPYAFRWEALGKKVKSPMDAYKAFRLPRVEADESVIELITSDDYPDTSVYSKPGDDDAVKVRAAFEAAMKIDLPLDAIFSDDAEERAALTRPRGSRSFGRRPAAGTQRPADGRQPTVAAKPARDKPGNANGSQGSQKASTAPAASKTAVVPSGRRKVEKAVQLAPDTIPCDDCGEPLDPKATVCPKCGATYANDDIDSGPQHLIVEQPREPKQTSVNEPAQAVGTDSAPGTCWSCKAPVESGTCTVCGIDQGDDLPF